MVLVGLLVIAALVVFAFSTASLLVIATLVVFAFSTAKPCPDCEEKTDELED